MLAVRHLGSYEKLKAAEAAATHAEEGERAGRILQQQDERFDTALNNIMQGLLMFDEAGQLLVVNRRFGRMFGVPDGGLAPGMKYDQVTEAVAAAGQVTAEDCRVCASVARS